jgi:hypothetical protein
VRETPARTPLGAIDASRGTPELGQRLGMIATVSLRLLFNRDPPWSPAAVAYAARASAVAS